jgi:hypothetical protein
MQNTYSTSKLSHNMTLNPQQNIHQHQHPQTNELSRFGHSVTLCKQKKIYNQ